MIYLQLFLGFLKVGLFSFGGGYASIPLIRDIVLSYGWMDENMLTYMIAVSESTPGPIMVNIATYVGASQGGVIGAMLATVAVVLPAFVIVIAVTAVLSKVITNKYVQAVLDGMIPCIIGIIMVTGAWMIFTNLFLDYPSAIDIRALIITFLLGFMYFGQKYVLKKRFSPILLIVISAGMGIAAYGI